MDLTLQRLPKDADGLREFPAKLYNAPVTPLRRLDERTLDGVVINNLQFMRTGLYTYACRGQNYEIIGPKSGFRATLAHVSIHCDPYPTNPLGCPTIALSVS